MNIHGPMKTRFVQLGFISSKKKGCSLDGREAYNLLKSNKVMELIFCSKLVNKVKLGDPMLLSLANEYSRLRYKELSLTCYQRSFCQHEIAKFEVYNGAASRLESKVYSDQVMLMSSQFRHHVIEN